MATPTTNRDPLLWLFTSYFIYAWLSWSLHMPSRMPACVLGHEGWESPWWTQFHHPFPLPPIHSSWFRIYRLRAFFNNNSLLNTCLSCHVDRDSALPYRQHSLPSTFNLTLISQGCFEAHLQLIVLLMLLNFQMGDVLSLKSVGLEEQEYHLEPKL